MGRWVDETGAVAGVGVGLFVREGVGNGVERLEEECVRGVEPGGEREMVERKGREKEGR